VSGLAVRHDVLLQVPEIPWWWQRTVWVTSESYREQIKMLHSFRNQISSSILQNICYYPFQIFIFVINPPLSSLPVHTFTSCCPFFHIRLSILSLPVAHTFTSCCPFFHILLPILSLTVAHSFNPVVHTFTSCCPYFNFMLSILSLHVHTFTSCC